MSKKTTRASEELPVTSFVSGESVIGEMLYCSIDNATSFAISTNGEIQQVTRFKLGKQIYVPYTASNPLLKNRVIRFPEKPDKYDSTETLVRQVRLFIRSYMELPKTIEDIAVYYVFLSWIYDAFNELPYLRIRGDYGTGKTRFLNIMGALCYKPIMASGASTVAPLFHMLNEIGGTLILDEADYRFSSETAEITKILNNGNARGFPVLRCERREGREFKPKAYNVYGPKVIASRGTYQDEALESRCITIDTNFGRKRTDIELSLPLEFEIDACKLRNRLLSWRFDNCLGHFKTRMQQSPFLSERLNQVYMPLLAMIKDQSIRDGIIDFARTAAEQSRVDQGLKLEADILRTIKKRIDEHLPLNIGSIAEDFHKAYSAQYERRITPNWVGSIIRTRLMLATRKSKGNYIIREGQLEVLKKLYLKFDITH